MVSQRPSKSPLLFYTPQEDLVSSSADAACKGQHDVGSLAKNGRHHSHVGSTHSVQSHRSHPSPAGSLTNLAYG